MAIKNGKLVDSEQNTLYVETKASLLINDDGTKWTNDTIELVNVLPQPNYYLSLKKKLYMFDGNLYYLKGVEGVFEKKQNTNKFSLGCYGFDKYKNMFSISVEGFVFIYFSDNAVNFRTSVQYSNANKNNFAQIGNDIYLLTDAVHKKFNMTSQALTTIQLAGYEDGKIKFFNYIAVGDKIYMFGAYFNPTYADQKLRVYEPSTGKITEYQELTYISQDQYINIGNKIYYVDSDVLYEFDTTTLTISKTYNFKSYYFKRIFTDGMAIYSIDNNRIVNRFNFKKERFEPLNIAPLGNEELTTFIANGSKVYLVDSSKNNIYILTLGKTASWKKITAVDVE